MTCKDCIYYEVCHKKEWYLEFGNISDYEGIETECKYFKDKSKSVELPCKVGDVLYDVVLCDDEKYRIFEMKVADISPFGTLYSNSKVCEPFIWNLYLVEKYSYAYRMFKDIGQTVFFEKSKAEAKLKELMENENA